MFNKHQHNVFIQNFKIEKKNCCYIFINYYYYLYIIDKKNSIFYILYIIILFIIDGTTLVENRLLRMKNNVMARVFRLKQT